MKSSKVLEYTKYTEVEYTWNVHVQHLLQLVVAKRAVRGGPGRIFIGPVRFRAEFDRINSWTDSRVHELKQFIFLFFFHISVELNLIFFKINSLFYK